MFKLNDKVVYPGHGVARINRIVEKIIGGQKTIFYELKFLNKDMTILAPTNNFANLGIRPLCSADNLLEVYKILSEPVKLVKNGELSASNWNKRNKEYQLKLRTGNLRDILEIYRDLKHISHYKELSFGEKNLLTQTESLLAEEIAIVQNFEEEKALEHLRSMVGGFKNIHLRSPQQTL